MRKELKEDAQNILKMCKAVIKLQQKIENNEKASGTLEVKKGLFYAEKLLTALKGLKNNKAPSADSVVN